jgi:hypothetical protein
MDHGLEPRYLEKGDACNFAIGIESRVIMRAWLWVLIALAGFGVMVLAFTRQAQPDPDAPWAYGLVVISPEPSTEKGPFLRAIPVRLRLLSSNDPVELILILMGQGAPEKSLGVKAQVRVKLIELPLAQAGIDAKSLQSGRLPEAGRDEILAGARTEGRDRLIVGGHSLKVVGTLKPELALFADSFLVPPSDSASSLFPPAVPSVHHATLVQLTLEQSRDRQALRQLEAAFPPSKYAWAMPQERLDRRTYYLYLAGLAVMLLGGSGALIGLFRWLAGKVRRPWLLAPLLEMQARPRLVWAVHLLYFGTVILAAYLTYELPDVQAVLLSIAHDAIAAPQGILATVGKAYLNGNLPLAAAATFAVNFFLGSLLVLTLPSIIVPGSGIFMAGLRSWMWGLLFGPTMRALAFTMLPHSWTMLLEGEGYVLATFFGLLIPIHIVQSSLGGNFLSRWGRVLGLNVKANAWVALVLAVAACYEATELIMLNRW